MKMNDLLFSLVTVLCAVTLSAQAKTSRHPATVSGPCDKEAVSAAKGFAADEGDEACVKEKATITNASNQRGKKEWVYAVDVDCGGGTSFTETVLLNASCTVLNPQ
jgi:hypothetical protein